MPKTLYDIPDVCRDFQLRKFDERPELVKQIREMMETPQVKLLMAEIAEAAAENHCNPIQVLGLGFNYGVAIGILAEKYRRRILSEAS